MAQQMILARKYKNISTQTGDTTELFINFTNKKTAKIYFSTAYKARVLSINFGTSKSFIFTKDMWNILKKHISQIDKILNND